MPSTSPLVLFYSSVTILKHITAHSLHVLLLQHVHDWTYWTCRNPISHQAGFEGRARWWIEMHFPHLAALSTAGTLLAVEDDDEVG